MSLRFANGIAEQISNVGSGDYILSGRLSGFGSVADAIASGELFLGDKVTVTAYEGSKREYATATITANGLGYKLVQDTIHEMQDGSTRTLTPLTGIAFQGGGKVVISPLKQYLDQFIPLTGIVTSADQMLYSTAADTLAQTPFTAAARILAAQIDTPSQRATLGLGTTDNVAFASGTFTGSLSAAAGYLTDNLFMTNTKGMYWGSSLAFTGNSATQTLSYTTNGVERITIGPDGQFTTNFAVVVGGTLAANGGISSTSGTFTGNIGIGSPASMQVNTHGLHITSIDGAGVKLQGAAGNESNILFSDGANRAQIASTVADDLRFRTGPLLTDALEIDSSQNSTFYGDISAVAGSFSGLLTANSDVLLAGTANIYKASSSNELFVSGGSAVNLGANFILRAETHPTEPGDWHLRSSGTDWLYWNATFTTATLTGFFNVTGDSSFGATVTSNVAAGGAAFVLQNTAAIVMKDSTAGFRGVMSMAGATWATTGDNVWLRNPVGLIAFGNSSIMASIDPATGNFSTNGTASIGSGGSAQQLIVSGGDTNGSIARFSRTLEKYIDTWSGNSVYSGHVAEGHYQVRTGGNFVTPRLTILDTGDATFANSLTASGLFTASGGANFSVQNAVDGGSARGIKLWSLADTSYGIYMASAGAGKALDGGTALASLDGRTGLQIRNRIYSHSTQAFSWENPVATLATLTADTGNFQTLGSITSGTYLKVGGSLNVTTIPVYADNAAAITGGLVAGDVYRNSTGSLFSVY